MIIPKEVEKVIYDKMHHIMTAIFLLSGHFNIKQDQIFKSYSDESEMLYGTNLTKNFKDTGNEEVQMKQREREMWAIELCSSWTSVLWPSILVFSHTK